MAARHAFRTSIKASVGLEVSFDKMHAYNADMDSTRREATAEIEWPELDYHYHGIRVLNEAEAATLSEDAVAKARQAFHPH
eukprot:jgi/Tetstr1/442404/TSEL_030530.t1